LYLYKDKIFIILLKKYLYVALASLCVVCGIIGIFVPLLPTTPFLLLATILYMRSSSRLLKWLLNNRYLGPYIKDYFSRKGIPLRMKVRSILILWVTLGLSAAYATDKLWVRIILAGIGTGVTVHLLIKKTREDSI